MFATRRSLHAAIAPEQHRDEIIAILAAGLARLIGAGGHSTGLLAEAAAALPDGMFVGMSGDGEGTMPDDRAPSAHGDALFSMRAEKLSESGGIGLELPDETRLSVVAG